MNPATYFSFTALFFIIIVIVSVKSVCQDHHKECAEWAKRDDECNKNWRYMLQKCPFSCHQCHCGDNHPTCDHWASIGECALNPMYMKPQCRKACKLCHPEDDELSSSLVDPTEENKEDSCENISDKCEEWAKVGECALNPGYMKENCKKACNICRPVEAEITKVVFEEKSCENYHEQCEEWANRGECANNPSYMKLSCRRSCKICHGIQKSDPKNSTLTETDPDVRGSSMSIEHPNIVSEKEFATESGNGFVICEENDPKCKFTIEWKK